MELKDITTNIDNLGRAFEEFKKTNDQRLNKIETANGTAELDAKLAKITDAMDKYEDTIAEIKTAFLRPGAGADAKKENDLAAKKAINEYMRKGIVNPANEAVVRKHFLEGYGLSEEKALSVDSDPNGGYLVRPEYSNEIIKDLREISPIRQIADVKTISTGMWQAPYNAGGVASGWVGERQPRTETANSTLEMITIPVHEIYAEPKATQTLLDDSFVDIEKWHQDEVIEEFAVQEGAGFVSGDGVARPKGFLSYAAGTSFNQIEQINSGHASLLTADGFINVQEGLKEIYQPNAKWVMERATRKLARQLKDSQNRYLFSLDASAGLNAESPMQILGKPIVIAEDMPSVGANALAVAYGDFKRGYKVIDRVGIRVLRDPFSSKPFILFYTTKRVGGGVVLFSAIKIMKIAA